MLDDASWAAVFAPGTGDSHFQGVNTPTAFQLDQHIHYDDAWFFSECARLSYHSDAKHRQQALAQTGFHEHYWAETKDLAAGIWVRAANCILVFRGTNQPKNWLRNIDAMPYQFKDFGNVHSGFYEAFEHSWNDLKKHMPHYQQLLCCGHSLGAAMASIAARYCNADALFTYGSPRVGDKIFAQQFSNMHHIRCCNVDDIVTHLPPSKDPFIYQHIGEATWLGSKQRKRDFYKERLKDPKQWFSTPKHLRDHAPINYSTRLAHLIKL